MLLLFFLPVDVLKAEEVAVPAEKDPGTAMLLSMACPGAGQIYNGKYLKAAAYLGLDSYMVYNALANQDKYRKSDDKLFRDERNKYIWWGVGGWLLGALDAYVDAHLSLFPSEDLNVEIRAAELPRIQLTWYFK